jgi:hypothetical protein
VDCIAGALAAEVGDEESDVGLRLFLVLINAQKKIAGPEDIENLFLERNVGARPNSQF